MEAKQTECIRKNQGVGPLVVGGPATRSIAVFAEGLTRGSNLFQSTQDAQALLNRSAGNPGTHWRRVTTPRLGCWRRSKNRPGQQQKIVSAEELYGWFSRAQIMVFVTAGWVSGHRLPVRLPYIAVALIAKEIGRSDHRLKLVNPFLI